MTVKFDGSHAQITGEGYSAVFNVDKMIRTKIPIKEIRRKLGNSTKIDLREIDGILTRDDARALIPEVLDEVIQTYVQAARVGRQLVQVQRVSGGSPSFFREKGFEAEFVKETSAFPIKHPEWEKFTIDIHKFGVQVVMSREMKEDSRWDLMARSIFQASLAMARKEDAMIIQCLNDGVPNNSAITTTGVKGVGGFGTKVKNHRYAMGSAETSNPLTFRAIAKGYTALAIEGFTPDVMLVHPFQMYDLMTMEGDFLGANERAYLAIPEQLQTAMRTGFIGSVMGVRVYQSNSQPAGQILMFDSKQYSVWAERSGVGIEDFKDVTHQMDGVVVSQRAFPAAILRDCAVMMNKGKENLLSTLV